MILISETTLETTLVLYLDFRVLESSFWYSGGETTKPTLMQVTCLCVCLFISPTVCLIFYLPYFEKVSLLVLETGVKLCLI